MKTVKLSEVTNIGMTTGGEKKYSKIVLLGILKEWVGFGWIELRDATAADIKKYPTVIDD